MHRRRSQVAGCLIRATCDVNAPLVICRPGGRDDVPFRSVASRLIKGLSDEARDLFQLDVLRPATFAALNHVLRAAKAAGSPYHVVHFDGHGIYAVSGAASGLIPSAPQ
jgi:hypothetical protein